MLCTYGSVGGNVFMFAQAQNWLSSKWSPHCSQKTHGLCDVCRQDPDWPTMSSCRPEVPGQSHLADTSYLPYSDWHDSSLDWCNPPTHQRQHHPTAGMGDIHWISISELFVRCWHYLHHHKGLWIPPSGLEDSFVSNVDSPRGVPIS